MQCRIYIVNSHMFKCAGKEHKDKGEKEYIFKLHVGYFKQVQLNSVIMTLVCATARLFLVPVNSP